MGQQREWEGQRGELLDKLERMRQKGQEREEELLAARLEEDKARALREQELEFLKERLEEADRECEELVARFEAKMSK